MREAPAGSGEGPAADGGEVRSAFRFTGARSRRAPLFRLLLYYVAVVGVMGALGWVLPLARHAFISPIEVPAYEQGAAIITGRSSTAPPAAAPTPSLQHPPQRTIITALVLAGALALALPVAWIYMHTRRLRYDASLVQSVIILPVVVAGILMIVKASLALAFALAGIVGAVRFRNTLKDPKDLVYIFLASGLGIAAGVQALDIALVLSLSFNLVVLGLWRFNVGAIYSREYGPRSILSTGDRRLFVAQTAAARTALRERMKAAVGEMKPDGALLVHSAEPESARHAVELSLSQTAKEWKLVGATPGPRGVSTLEFLLQLKKKATLVDLLGELDERWATQVAAAEFVPLKWGTPKPAPVDAEKTETA